MAVTISINPYVSPRLITVLAPAVEITMQELVNRVMEWEELPSSLTHERIIKASGKQDLGGDPKVLVGITATLLNAQVKFEDRSSPTDCDIYGGNLVAVNANGVPINPIQYATFVTVSYAKSSSATAIETGVSGLTSEESEKLMQIDYLPTTSELAVVHGSGSWEGATPTQLWDYDDRKLTSTNVESEVPGENLSTEAQVEEVKELIKTIKVGRGFSI